MENGNVNGGCSKEVLGAAAQGHPKGEPSFLFSKRLWKIAPAIFHRRGSFHRLPESCQVEATTILTTTAATVESPGCERAVRIVMGHFQKVLLTHLDIIRDVGLRGAATEAK